MSEVRLVVLDVGVRDSQGRPVLGLPKEAFRVLDSGRSQALTNFAAEDAPVTMGLVLDTSRSMRNHRSQSVSASTTLIAESRSDDEVFLITFNDDVVAVPPAPLPQLRERVEAAPREGRTALYDAVSTGLRELTKGTRERKALVVISDGADTASRITREAVLDEVRQSQAVIYAVGMTGDLPHDQDPGFLREMARISGGDVFLDIAPGQLAEVCRQIAREIRSRYVLAFHAAEAGSRARLRSVRVEATAPDRGRLRVLSRRHYLALPPAGGSGREGGGRLQP